MVKVKVARFLIMHTSNGRGDLKRNYVKLESAKQFKRTSNFQDTNGSEERGSDSWVMPFMPLVNM